MKRILAVLAATALVASLATPMMAAESASTPITGAATTAVNPSTEKGSAPSAMEKDSAKASTSPQAKAKTRHHHHNRHKHHAPKKTDQ
jgi:hypothetical protein